MAGDWIKVESTTPDKPEVVKMADRLQLDQDAVTGKLLRVWSWANANSVTGDSIAVTCQFIDRLTACRGFAVAMRDAGWLEGRDGALTFPRFDRHNGQSAKARAESARRMAKSRSGCENVAEKAQQKAQPEKRREEKSNTDTHSPGEIPSVEEVVKFGKGCTPEIPEDYCRTQHAKHSEDHRWLVQGRLIDWRAKFRRYWSQDKETHGKQKPGSSGVRPAVTDYSQF